MEDEQVMETELVVVVVRDGDGEWFQSEPEAQHHASLFHVCRCTVRHHSEKHLQTQPDATKRVSPTVLLTCGAGHSPLLSPLFPKPLAAYSVWTQNISACLLIHYSGKRETGKSTVRPDTCKGLKSLYTWKWLDRCSDTRKPHRFRASSSQQPRQSPVAKQQITTPHSIRSMRTTWSIGPTSHSTIAILSRSSEMNMSFWATWALSDSTSTHQRRQCLVSMSSWCSFFSPHST